MGGCGNVRALPERGIATFTYKFLAEHYETRYQLTDASERQLAKVTESFGGSRDVDQLAVNLRRLADEIRLQSYALAFSEALEGRTK